MELESLATERDAGGTDPVVMARKYG